VSFLLKAAYARLYRRNDIATTDGGDITPGGYRGDVHGGGYCGEPDGGGTGDHVGTVLRVLRVAQSTYVAGRRTPRTGERRADGHVCAAERAVH